MSLETEAVAITRNGSEASITLRGDSGLDLAKQLHQSAIALSDDARAVDVDCSQIEHLDSSVLQVLLALKERLAQSGGTVRFRGENPQVRGYLDLSGLSLHFPHTADSEK